ncbi:hypothetical protein [Serratia fonticola]|uniref:hypothetical protein n=1 Tax=Serratia fonticola TaxID=47917 RepID=UPI0013777F4A|nr:hypothetical protein [Serratia fonticola]NBJ34259.1 hypothetical protein [Serratia fonticola]
MAKGKLNAPKKYVCNFSELLTLVEPDISKVNRKRKRVRRDKLFYLGETKVQVKKKHRPSSPGIKASPKFPTLDPVNAQSRVQTFFAARLPSDSPFHCYSACRLTFSPIYPTA